MLALVSSLLLALYLLGPDLISRWLLGFVVPRKSLVQSRGEEVTRAVLWATIPFALAYFWARAWGTLALCFSSGSVQTFFAGLYSDTIFARDPGAWFASSKLIFWLNVCLLWRLYFLVFAFSLLLNFTIKRYGSLRSLLPYSWMKATLATVVLPRISEWHVLLSDMLLPSKNFSLHADVLTKTVLYQGTVQDKVLSADGNLQSLTLGNPRRFLRERYEEQRKLDQSVEKEAFWRSIPGNLFVLIGSDIVNVNLRYIRKDVMSFEPSEAEKEILRALLARLTEPQRGRGGAVSERVNPGQD